MSELIFIFDMDNTLTAPLSLISLESARTLIRLADKYKLYICTGSNKEKLEKQISPKLCNIFQGIFTNSGAQYYRKTEHVYTFPKPNLLEYPKLKQYLGNVLETCEYKMRTGIHYEIRPGSINFSIVGRNADDQCRKHFVDWHTGSNELYKIANYINTTFAADLVSAFVGGQTSIDIYFNGFKGKESCVDFLEGEIKSPHKYIFIGDKIMPCGNDYDVSLSILHSNLGGCFRVSNPDECNNLLKRFL